MELGGLAGALNLALLVGREARSSLRFQREIVPRRQSPLTFFVLVFALSVPFWLAGAVVGRRLLPGLSVVNALTVVCPLLAASMLAFGENGAAGVKELLKRSLDHERIGATVWYLPILLLMPGLTAGAYVVMRVTGLPLPAPHLALSVVPVMFLGFFVGAAAEELGWSGYATDALQARWNALQTGIILGLVCAAWHIVPLVQLHRSPGWIAGWALWTVAARVITVWLFNNTGQSVFATALFHTTTNVSWQLFPNAGSHWDPRINGLMVAGAAMIVTVLSGGRMLARSPARRSKGP